MTTLPRPKAPTAKIVEFKDRLSQAGLKPEFCDRGFTSGLPAVNNGMPVDQVVAALVKNRAEMFDAGLARKRQEKQLRLSPRR